MPLKTLCVPGRARQDLNAWRVLGIDCGWICNASCRSRAALDPLNDGRAKSRVDVLLDVTVTGTLFSNVVDELRRQTIEVVGAVTLVDAGVRYQSSDVPFKGLCVIPIDVAAVGDCHRCGVLQSVEFNPIACRMTKKKMRPRSPSEFLAEDPSARELWDLVDAAGAYEHHRVIGRNHYVGFIDTVRLLTHTATAPVIREKACARIAERAGVPETIVVPGRARAVLFGKQLIAEFANRLGVK